MSFPCDHVFNQLTGNIQRPLTFGDPPRGHQRRFQTSSLTFESLKGCRRIPRKSPRISNDWNGVERATHCNDGGPLLVHISSARGLPIYRQRLHRVDYRPIFARLLTSNSAFQPTSKNQFWSAAHFPANFNFKWNFRHFDPVRWPSIQMPIFWWTPKPLPLTNDSRRGPTIH